MVVSWCMYTVCECSVSLLTSGIGYFVGHKGNKFANVNIQTWTFVNDYFVMHTCVIYFTHFLKDIHFDHLYF